MFNQCYFAIHKVKINIITQFILLLYMWSFTNKCIMKKIKSYFIDALQIILIFLINTFSKYAIIADNHSVLSVNLKVNMRS